MLRAAPNLDAAVNDLRAMLPAHTATAQAIDRHEPWDQIAMKAIDDGYVESADEFVQFVEACLRCGA